MFGVSVHVEVLDEHFVSVAFFRLRKSIHVQVQVQGECSGSGPDSDSV